MEDLWTTRDLPVLQFIVEKLEDPNFLDYPNPGFIAAMLGMDAAQVERSLALLAKARPPYIEGPMASESDAPIYISEATERAYREVGAWPTAEALTDRLEAAFRAAAAVEPDAEKRSKLQAVLGAFSGIGRAVTTDVITQVVEHQMGLG